jgi:AcrR family transcriptional regulator
MPNLSTRGGILDTAAHLLAERDASMAEIATAAGVARTTLYRHYPTREALLEALAEQALGELSERIADAHLDTAPVPEAIERLARALLTVADRYIVLVRERAKPHHEETERHIGGPLRAVFERGVATGVLRADITADAQLQLFGSLVTGALEAGLQRELGVEQAADVVTSLYLRGAATPAAG